MATKELERFFLSFYESMLRAQINALRQFRKSMGLVEKDEAKEKRMSQPDMAFEILKDSQRPMHVSELLVEIEKRFGVKVDRESLVSALTKRIRRQDRFMKVGPNTFALLTEQGGGKYS